MAQMRLDLNLAPKLVLHVALDELLLLQDLDGHDVLTILLAGEIHHSKLPAAERSSDVKVVQAPKAPVTAFVEHLFWPQPLGRSVLFVRHHSTDSRCSRSARPLRKAAAPGVQRLA
eukprot:scaffold770_cov255-Pinguiococcus_pyrenoidosus.AAC.28